MAESHPNSGFNSGLVRRDLNTIPVKAALSGIEEPNEQHLGEGGKCGWIAV